MLQCAVVQGDCGLTSGNGRGYAHPHSQRIRSPGERQSIPPVDRPRLCFSMRTRLTFLVATLGIAVIAVACGRASQADIDSALGITPTATLSADQIATGTANA